jgi:hypothetical protein
VLPDNTLFKPLKEWFDRLASRYGPAALLPMVSVCRMSTGETGGALSGTNLRALVCGTDAAAVTKPNRSALPSCGHNDRYGNIQIRCFMPGAGTAISPATNEARAVLHKTAQRRRLCQRNSTFSFNTPYGSPSRLKIENLFLFDARSNAA